MWRTLAKGLGWVLVPAVIVGGLALFLDPYAEILGSKVCDGDFYTTKTAYNVVDIESSYRFFCLTEAGTSSLTMPLWGISAALWYGVFALVWLWMWYGDVYRRGWSDPEPRDDTAA